MRDLTAVLPNGNEYDFWEVEEIYHKELFVDGNHLAASDNNDGSINHPFRTINAAANVAEPGTRIWIHGGVYRECVRPKRGGTDPSHMICYEAVPNENVIIKASEVVTDFVESVGWRKEGPNNIKNNVIIWKHCLKPEMFMGYNPFCAVNILHDRLFIEYDKTDMSTYLNRRGMVFCDGEPLKQVALYNELSTNPGSFWVEANGQTVHFRLKDDSMPQEHVIELTCREQCFAPDIPFLSYIKVKGITCSHAAMGAPVPQRGSISCMRGHHWIIENCTVDWSNAVGIDVGNECWHHEIIEGQLIGYSIIRGCNILNAGVCAIAGLFAVHMLIEDNLIQGTGWQKMELSWEAAGIKLHNSVGGLIRRNIFTKTLRADHVWLDCGNENNRITQNLFLDGIEQREAVFMECSRDGVNLIDNNIFWNIEGRFNSNDIPKEPGSSGWYKMQEHSVVNGYAVYGEGTDYLYISNNLIGKCRSAGYFAKPVSFRMGGLQRGGTSRDAHIINNVFYDCGEAAIKMPTEKNESQGNMYVKMQGGYLRILNPQPEVCLDLPAWKEFYGFDQDGQEAWFDIAIDTEKFELMIQVSDQRPFAFPGQLNKRNILFNCEVTQEVTTDVLVSNDFYGNEKNKCSIPGPFSSLKNGFIYSIDPRKKN